MRVMRKRGLDLSGHLSDSVDSALQDFPVLILTMTGQHLRELVEKDRSLLFRAFTLKEFVRLAEVEGQRASGENIRSYVERVGGSRGLSARRSWGHDDISDPYGRRRSAYERCAAEIEGEVSRLATLLYPENQQ